MLFRALLFALEGVVRIVLEEGDEGRRVKSESFERARAVMLRVATAAIAGEGASVAPLPMEEQEPAPAKASTSRRAAAGR
jgi:hypothetical protein